jgi:Protein of unknown function (DUF1778)
MARPAGILFRHCVAGDQWPDPADPLRIDQALLLQLARATRHLRAAWSYTHFPMGPANQASLRLAAAKGLVVNACTESRSRAAALVRQGIPAGCVVPLDALAVFHHEGVRFVACPASRSGRKVRCISCGGRLGVPLCAQADRGFVITFRPWRPRGGGGPLQLSGQGPMGLAPGGLCLLSRFAPYRDRIFLAVVVLTSTKPHGRRPAKTSRIELRATQDDRDLLDRAAAALGTDRSSFLLSQGRLAAQQIQSDPGLGQGGSADFELTLASAGPEWP